MPDRSKSTKVKPLATNIYQDPIDDFLGILDQLGVESNSQNPQNQENGLLNQFELNLLDSTDFDELPSITDILETLENLDGSPSTISNPINMHNHGIGDILSELDELDLPVTTCQICGHQTLKDTLLAGICFECHTKQELIQDRVSQTKDSNEDALATILMKAVIRISELEAKVGKLVEEKGVLIQEKHSQSDTPPVPPKVIVMPPPPPPYSGNDSRLPGFSDIKFSQMTLEELKEYTPEYLSELSLSQRNQYNSRLKELQLIEKMTPKQRKEYFLKKEKEQEQATKLDELRDSLKILSESNNSFFMKMKQQAEKSVLAGQGTLGNFGPKDVFVSCHKCNTTNKIKEGKEILCKNCHAPLIA